MQSKFGELPAPADEKRPAPRPFSRPPGSGAAIIGMRGNPDYLPNLPDGDLTLLNEKADQYAVFVIRVATQVFGQLRSSGWEQLQYGDIANISDYNTIEAILSPRGELLRVLIHAGSGSARFDRIVEASVTRGARDPNPPPGAAAPDGNVHFIFKAKSWSEVGHQGRMYERRWLTLATGLE
jgi:hypothetical protein